MAERTPHPCQYIETDQPDLAPLTAAVARALVGKEVRFVLSRDVCPHRKVCYRVRRGVVDETMGRNIRIDYDWYAFKEVVDLIEFTV